MEQILAFVLGVGAVTLIWVVVVVSRALRKANQTEQRITDLISDMSEIPEIHRRIDQEIDRVDKLHRDSEKHTDSRTDKNSARINDLVAFTDLSQHAIEKLQYQLAELQVASENYINKEK
jgi:hypothetical protein